MRRHSTDAVSLSFGLIFVAIAGWWLTGRYVEVDIPNLGWFAAAALIVVGVLGVVGSLRRERGGSAGAPAAAAPQDKDTSRENASPGKATSREDAPQGNAPWDEAAPPASETSAPHSSSIADPDDTRLDDTR